jgi:endonuclease YncB( thermonuclease family)
MMNAPVRRLKRPYRPVGSTFGRRASHAARRSHRPPDPARRLLAMMLICGAAAVGFYAVPYLPASLNRIVERMPYADTLVGWLPASRTEESSSVLRPSEGRAVAARIMPICGDGYRANCVVDGDTVWVDHEKIRLETIDAPEVHGRCNYETDLAAKATRRLQSLLSGQRMTIVRSGNDIYGRTLARVSTDRGEVGGILASEGLARRWTGHREPWC